MKYDNFNQDDTCSQVLKSDYVGLLEHQRNKIHPKEYHLEPLITSL
ncbi:14515_t:CDS:2 [Dentiscutata erythropus]|uniref:14515_t:CDS:1 n=1 Tax=Dentiscutata erythropus TaxID=1348616 RepID=A0A9N9DKI3_9GLOM|nr:14515_t:CDS:2 [Dentiscutata erythropus]